MENRIPASGQEGRVYIVPENGEPFYATITMADGATVLGTAWSKENVLQDTTAALYGLDPTAVPDAVLAMLGRFNSGLGNEYIWAKEGSSPVVGSVETPTSPNGPYIGLVNSSSISYSDSVEIVDGQVQLSSPVNSVVITYDVNSGVSNLNQIAGKYIEFSNDAYPSSYRNAVAFIPTDAEYIQASSYWGCKYALVSIGVTTTYVNSPDPDAYPPAVSDGYTYEALGKIGESKIITGTYSGNSSIYETPQTIDLGVTPSAVLVVTSGYDFGDFQTSNAAMAITGTPAGPNQNNWVLKIVEGGFKVQSYSGTGNLNMNGYEYLYIAWR